MDWASVVYNAGYFDQAHFIKEFAHFSGLRPGEYLASQLEHNHAVSDIVLLPFSLEPVIK